MKRINILYLFFVFIFIYTDLYAQTPQENLDKYWLYRERLRKYFVVVDPNNNFGTNIPFMYRSTNGSDESAFLTTGDGNDGLQYYIGMLATEYAVFKKFDLDYTQTRNELLYALQAVERLDLYAENYFRKLPEIYNNGDGTGTNVGNYYSKIPTSGNVQTGDLNGFFIRDDIGLNFIETWSKTSEYSSISNYNTVKSLFTEGHGRNMPYEQSQDNVWNYIPNLALVYVLVDDPVIQQKVKDITYRMVNFMHYNITNRIYYPCGLFSGCFPGEWRTITTSTWKIVNPVTGFEVIDGARVEELSTLPNGLPLPCTDVAAFNYGFAEAGCFISGNSLHFGCSNTIESENWFYNYLAYPFLWPSANSHYALATVGGNTPNYQKYSIYDNSINRHQTIMDALLINIAHPIASKPTQLEHLPLIRALIVKYQMEHGNFSNQLDIESFEYAVSNSDLREFYENLLNEAPICGPSNKKTTINPDPNRVNNWCLENRLTLSHTIYLDDPDDPSRKMIDNPYNRWGVFSGIDYLMLHNLYWLNFVPTDKIIVSDCNTYTIQKGRQITSTCVIPSGKTVNYTASEKISLKPGFSAQSGSSFTAKINKDWAFHQTDPSELIATNNCFSGMPFSTPNLKAYIISENNYEIFEDSILIKQNNELDFKILPNPNNGDFSICLNDNINKCVIQLFNNSGVLLETFYPSNNTIQISVQTAGVYFIVLTTSEGIIIKKQVICN